ncbi:hypothetical protein D3C80_1245670 [compost metagenome]
MLALQQVMVVVAGQPQGVTVTLIQAPQQLRDQADGYTRQHAKRQNTAEGGGKGDELLQSLAPQSDKNTRVRQLKTGVDQDCSQTG